MKRVDFTISPPLCQSVKIVRAEVIITELILFTSVNVVVYLYDERESVVDTRQFFIDGPEYNAWNDDNYLIELIKNKIAM